MNHRRDFLKFLAGSPLAALAFQKEPDPDTLANPADAINVMEFEAACRRNVPPAHFGYMTTGVDDDATLKQNHEAFRHIQLRPRRLVDVRTTDLKTDLFGTVWDTPIFICPCGSQGAFHPDGELATARAAQAKKHLMIMSTVASHGVEEISKAYGKPVWYQLYASSKWEVTEKLVKRAEAAGCPVLALTVDLPAGRNTETQKRFRKLDTRNCATCHQNTPGAIRKKAMFEGIDVTGVALNAPAMDWAFVDRLKKLTSMKLLLKGIELPEDAALACEHGVDGIIVSNHGGRAEESGRATIECLPEVVGAVHGRIPVLLDGGIRRGTDVFKALALGARAVGIGRPYLWGLGAFGQPGVERVLEILRYELDLVMRQCGTPSIAKITRASVV